MSAYPEWIDNLRVAGPCSASWDGMEGDEKTRYCGECKLHVHDFSAMRAAEIETILRGAAGRVCARMRRRADGTVVTADCDTVRRALRRRLRRVRIAAAALFALVVPLAGAGCDSRVQNADTSHPTPSSEPQDPAQAGVTKPDELEPIELRGGVCPPKAMLGKVIMPKARPPKGDKKDG